MYWPTNLFIFDIPLLYYYTNLNSSIIYCLFSGDIYLSFGISISFCECNSFEDFFERFVVLSAMLLSIKSLVVSAGFSIALFEAVFIASVVDFLAALKRFWLYSLPKSLPLLLAKDKNPYPFTLILSLGSI